MKRTITIVLAVLVALLAGCARTTLTGSGNIVTREETFTGFDKLDISHGFNVDVRQAETSAWSSALTTTWRSTSR